MDEEVRELVERYRPRVVAMLEKATELHDVEVAREAAALDEQSVDPQPSADALESQTVAAGSGQRRIMLLARLRHTLARMDEGEFGFCTQCGERIDDDRLDSDPWNHLCLTCASLRI